MSGSPESTVSAGGSRACGAADGEAGGWEEEPGLDWTDEGWRGHRGGSLVELGEGHRSWAAAVQGARDLGPWQVPKLQYSSLLRPGFRCLTSQGLPLPSRKP